jgi:hypothetical protein
VGPTCRLHHLHRFLSSLTGSNNRRRLLPSNAPPPLKTLPHQAPCSPLPSPSGSRAEDAVNRKKFLAGVQRVRRQKFSSNHLGRVPPSHPLVSHSFSHLAMVSDLPISSRIAAQRGHRRRPRSPPSPAAALLRHGGNPESLIKDSSTPSSPASRLHLPLRRRPPEPRRRQPSGRTSPENISPVSLPSPICSHPLDLESKARIKSLTQRGMLRSEPSRLL